MQQYKEQYEAICERNAEQVKQVKTYMDGTMSKVYGFFSKTEDELSKVSDSLTTLKETSTVHKFDIDKLMASTTTSDQLTKRLESEINDLKKQVLVLDESKTDNKKYLEETQVLVAGLNQTRETALRSESLTQTMVEFIHKFEPIYI